MKYLFLIIGIVCGIFWSQIYQYAGGFLNDSITMQKPSSSLQSKRTVTSIATPSIEPIKQNVSENPKQVLMYSTSWCGYCSKARNYFIKNKITFLDYDIETDERAGRMHDLLGGGGVPLIIYNGKMMHGFSENKFLTMQK